MRLNQGRLEANAARGRIDVGAGVLQQRARFIVQEVDTDLFQHGKGGLMDRFELVAGDQLERRERRFWLANRVRRARPSAALGRASAPAPRVLRRRTRRH